MRFGLEVEKRGSRRGQSFFLVRLTTVDFVLYSQGLAVGTYT